MFLSLFFNALHVLDDALKTFGVNQRQRTLIFYLEKKIVSLPRKKRKKKKSKGYLFAEKMKEKRLKEKTKSLIGMFN